MLWFQPFEVIDFALELFVHDKKSNLSLAFSKSDEELDSDCIALRTCCVSRGSRTRDRR